MIIKKERIHLMRPCAQVCAVAAFEGIVEKAKLLTAIQSAVKQHQILSSRVRLFKCAYAPDDEERRHSGMRTVSIHTTCQKSTIS